ncbi:hypothetical protein [Halovivax sp.]|nr:hypothetical protein [Halovivax sp.]
MSTKETLKDTVAEHPRMIGFLFAVMMLLSQAGSVAASSADVGYGP